MSKILIIGTGFVGSTIAYSILHRGIARELVLVDTDASRAEGEAMDLSHAIPFLKNVKIQAAPLDAVGRADLAIIAAGRNSIPGETRLDLLKDNAGRIRSICGQIKTWRQAPLVLVVSNPVDVLTQIASEELGDHGKVLGSGTTLDTARLKTLLGDKFGFDPHSIHGYILGEHGDSEFPAWSTVTAGGVNIRDWPGYDARLLQGVFEQVRTAAYEIIKRKRATYFAIGAATALIAEAILRDQRSILPVSIPLRGQYGLRGVSLSLPCVLGREGVARVLEPRLLEEEQRALKCSAEIIQKTLPPHLAA